MLNIKIFLLIITLLFNLIQGKDTFLDLVDWFKSHGGTVNKIEMKHLTDDNRYIVAQEDIEVKENLNSER